MQDTQGPKWTTPRFPPKSRAAVAAEKLRAGKDFDLARKNLSREADIDEQTKRYILRQFVVLVREASKLGKRGIGGNRVEGSALEFLRRATIDAVYHTGRRFGERWISNWSGSLTLRYVGNSSRPPNGSNIRTCCCKSLKRRRREWSLTLRPSPNPSEDRATGPRLTPGWRGKT